MNNTAICILRLNTVYNLPTSARWIVAGPLRF
ncbi:hypothetical protein TorRG33x02_221860 [Trema orientale]|uniref:Uncharacterized protein n=1 Tax=Trema orientale TaxID=63057 RepID=A0A2P5E946_TREOI|nr:hypothetical protein TorRG33x02_221860 [Trema orientale]